MLEDHDNRFRSRDVLGDLKRRTAIPAGNHLPIRNNVVVIQDLACIFPAIDRDAGIGAQADQLHIKRGGKRRRGAGLKAQLIPFARSTEFDGAGAVSILNVIASNEVGAGKGVRLAAVDYRLSASKGWQDFTLPKAQARAARAPLSDLGKGGFRLDESAQKPSKFSTNIELGQSKEMAPPARGSAASGDYKLVVGGSFSISRKIDVTAGVRYASENDRVIPLADNRKDSEAVYVGTKIRF